MDENLVADQIHIVPCQLLTWIETLKPMGPFQMYPFLFQFVVTSIYYSIPLPQSKSVSQADMAFLPVRLFPWLLDNEESQVKDGLRFYPQLLTWFGTQINMVESYKDQSNLMTATASFPLAMLVMGIALRLSF